MKNKFQLTKEKDFFQVVCKKEATLLTDEAGVVVGLEIEGYASTKDKDRVNDIVLPEAFEESMREYMTNPIVLLQHEREKPIGIVVDYKLDNQGLWIKARITEDRDGVFSAIKNGVLRTFSIGYKVSEFKEEAVTARDENGNDMIVGWEWIITKLNLYEISVVSVPANPYALMKSLDSCFSKSEEEVIEETTETASDSVEEGKSAKGEGLQDSKELNLLGKEEEIETIETTEVVEEKEDKEDGDKEEVVDVVEEGTTTEIETPTQENGDKEEKEDVLDKDEVIEGENKEEGEETPKEEVIEETPSVEGESVKETEIEEQPKETEVPENQPESGGSDAETNIAEAKSMEVVKNLNVAFDEMKQTHEMSTKELKSMVDEQKSIIEKQADMIKGLSERVNGFGEVFDNLFKAMTELDATINSVVSKAGFPYEKPKENLSPYAKAIKVAKRIS